MKATKIVGIVSIIAGIVMIIAGALVWGTVTSQLKAEAITVPADSTFMGGAYAGKQVAGPLSAYAQADIINTHALAGADGKTYAELGALAREAKEAGDEAAAEEYTAQRTTAMNGSFLPRVAVHLGRVLRRRRPGHRPGLPVRPHRLGADHHQDGRDHPCGGPRLSTTSEGGGSGFPARRLTCRDQVRRCLTRRGGATKVVACPSPGS